MIVDYSILFYRFYHQIIKKVPEPDKYLMLKLIAGKLDSLAFELNRYNYSIAADLGTSFRKSIYPAYKGNRLKKDEKLKKLYFSTLQLFSDNGKDVLMYNGLEADDICYLYTEKYKWSIVVSEDSDMHQIVLNGVSQLYQPFKKCFYQGDAKLSLLTKLLLGDKSDNIPRCVRRGVGKKIIERVYKTGGSVVSAYVDNFSQYDLNRKLCDFSKIDYSKFKFKIK